MKIEYEALAAELREARAALAKAEPFRVYDDHELCEREAEALRAELREARAQLEQGAAVMTSDSGRSATSVAALAYEPSPAEVQQIIMEALRKGTVDSREHTLALRDELREARAALVAATAHAAEASDLADRFHAELREARAEARALRERAERVLAVGSPEQVVVAERILGAAPSPEPPPDRLPPPVKVSDAEARYIVSDARSTFTPAEALATARRLRERKP